MVLHRWKIQSSKFFEQEVFYNFAAKSLLTLTPSFCFLSKTILMQSHQLILF